MPGKARPSLRAKTLINVERSNLSITDKKCIKEVFEQCDNTKMADKIAQYMMKARTNGIRQFANYLRAEAHPDSQGFYIVLIDQITALEKKMAGDIPKIEHNSLCETDTYKVGE